MIFSAFERFVAFRYLRARRKEGFISVIAAFSFLGIMLGVATLIIVMSVMNGFRAELLDRVLGLNGHVAVMSLRGPLLDFDPLAEATRRAPGVIAVTPTVEGQVMASASGNASGAMVRGVRVEDLKRRPIIADNIVAGSLDALADGDSVMLGSRLARRLGVHVGDTLSLISPQGSVSPFGTVPRVRGVRVGALFEVGMFEYDNGFVFMPLQTAQQFFRTGDGVTNLEVMLAQPDAAPAVTADLRQRLGPDVHLYDWQQSNATFVNALDVERNVMFLILTLIIVVAAFNIISSMIMLVKDKGRDIAILRAMGATRGMIMRVFFLTGASVGCAGTLAGFVLGTSFALNIETVRQWIEALTGTNLFAAEIYFLSKLPAKIDSGQIVAVVVMGLTLSILATLYPSWRAGRLRPAEALRYE